MILTMQSNHYLILSLVALFWYRSSQHVDLYAACQNSSDGDVLKTDVSIPTFWDFIGTTNSYSVAYSVMHAARIDKSSTDQPSKQPSSTIWISESFDRNARLGKFEIKSSGTVVHEVYINGISESIHAFQPATGVCKRIKKLVGLLDDNSNFLNENQNFGLEKMYGLAALWIELSNFNGHFLLKEKTIQDENSGIQIRLRNYRLKSKVNSHSRDKVRFSLDMKFSAPSSESNDKFFLLKSIDFMPEYVDPAVGQSPLYRTVIHVDSLSDDLLIDWKLPAECAHLDDKAGAEFFLDESAFFPQVANLIEHPNGQFFMRSELVRSSGLSFGDEVKMYAMDEYFYRGDLRLKTYGYATNFDIIYFNETREGFDISTPYQCDASLPQIEEYLGPTKVGFMEFWSGEGLVSMVDDPSLLYYAPMSLWYLAEKNRAFVELVNNFDLAPIPTNREAGGGLECELRTQVWRFKGPNNSGPWTYDLYFEEMSQILEDGEFVRRWHVLDKIELNRQYDPNKSDLQQLDQVRVNVITYRYSLLEQEILDKFRVPDGYPCGRRNLEMQGRDELDVDLSLGYSMRYEASLELVDDGDSDALSDDFSTRMDTGVQSKRDTFILSGKVVDINESPVNIKSHYQKIHHLDGYVSSTKTVHDRKSGIVYAEDLTMGQCRISQQVNNRGWVLQLPIGNRYETLVLDKDLLELLFTKSNEAFQASYSYDSCNMSINVYKMAIDQLPNKAQDNELLDKQATIVRRYKKHMGSVRPYRVNGNGTRIDQYTDMSVKVLLFDEHRSKIQAILSIAVRGVANIGLVEALEDTNVAQCYVNNGGFPNLPEKRSFSIDYSGAELGAISQLNNISIMDIFLSKLIVGALILPTQIDGVPQLESNDDGLISIKFKLLEIPTAIKFAHQQFFGSRMSDDLHNTSENLVVTSLTECLTSCDQLDCVALTYSSTHTCRLLTLNMLRASSSPADASLISQGPLTPEEIKRLLSCVEERDSEYYIWTSPRPKSLDKIATYMDSLINERRNQDELDVFTLNLPVGESHTLMVPTRFHEIEDNLESLLEDSSEQSHHRTGRERPKQVYRKIWYNLVVEPLKLEHLNNKGQVNYKYELEHSLGYDECFKICKGGNCVAFSYCRQKTTCLLITGKGDLKKLEETLETSPEQMDCSVTIRDYSAEYLKFADTLAPTSYEFKIDGYSPLECASLCESLDGNDAKFKCLSFDSCTTESPSTASLICYLQKSHVMLDSFDKSILRPQNLDKQRKARISFKSSKVTPGQEANQNSSQQLACDHYSGSLISDYKYYPNKRLTAPEAASQTIRGSSPDKCAINCHDDEQCWAFEYCFDDKLQPAQFCHLIRYSITNQDEHIKLSWDFEQSLTPSTECSVYKLSHANERLTMDDKSVSVYTNTIKESGGFVKLASIASFSLVIGSLIQVFIYLVKKLIRSKSSRPNV